MNENRLMFSNLCQFGDLYFDYSYAPFGNGVFVVVCTDKSNVRYFCVLVYENVSNPFYLIRRISQARLDSFHWGYHTVYQVLATTDTIVKVTSSNLETWDTSEVIPISELRNLIDILNVHVPYRY